MGGRGASSGLSSSKAAGGGAGGSQSESKSKAVGGGGASREFDIETYSSKEIDQMSKAKVKEIYRKIAVNKTLKYNPSLTKEYLYDQQKNLVGTSDAKMRQSIKKYMNEQKKKKRRG